MIIISLILAFIFGALHLFLIFCIVAPMKEKKPKNNVHFYVARDKNGELYLYMNKPLRKTYEFICPNGKALTSATLPKNFSKYGLDAKDYANLKWEDEPVEVFINMEE